MARPVRSYQMNLFEPKLFTSVVQPKDICAASAGTPLNNDTNQDTGDFMGKYTTPAELKEVSLATKVIKNIVSGY